MRTRRAFTLIEAIVAIVITATAVPAMLFALRTAHLDRISPYLASQARWLAAERLEDVIADRASPARGFDFIVAANYPDEPSVPGAAGYAREVQITETEADLVTPGDGYKTVTVTVGWTHPNGKSQEIALSTVLTELD